MKPCLCSHSLTFSQQGAQIRVWCLCQVSQLRRREAQLMEQLSATRQEALEYGTGLRNALRDGDEARAKIEEASRAL